VDELATVKQTETSLHLRAMGGCRSTMRCSAQSTAVAGVIDAVRKLGLRTVE
jgi:hypothetical protein